MKQFLLSLLLCVVFYLPLQVKAQNPIVQTHYTADPAPLVYNGKLYLYTSHDEDNSTWFVMNNWKLYTTEDMVNWTDHGAVASYETFDWAIGDAWAIQVIERNGKFFLYAPVKSMDKKRSAIGVAVADNPYGPFYDPLGKPLISVSDGDIDPTVFLDADGKAYLYWGNPDCYYAELNDDMISLKGDAVRVPMTVASFGKREANERRPTLYEEGPWLYQRSSLYYLFWAGGPIPEHLGYSTSKTPTGPWKYNGTLMPPEGKSFTNHPGVVDYKGKTYLFYHSGALPGGNGFNRSVAVQEMNFKKDGSIAPMKMTDGIAKPLQNLNPYQKVEAETIAWSENVKASENKNVGVFVTAKKNLAYTKVKSVDFGAAGALKFTARVGTTHNSDVSMEVHADGLNGPLLSTVKVPLTGGNNRWAVVSNTVSKITGIHDLYFVFKGKAETDVAFFDYWMFTK
ncbi:carbohydrate binding protein with CBM6 domain [Pedobacter psychrotolerans]|uniref:Carbohydrate binding protein with CBM6 domain n=1 Tax=Pedobacter psychrotolerans TaxID=1843235 RepID=A0A4R2HHV2_9SPHI|nr:glycoside hydrolase family 43 protein [Pedobacter psychrotolerans]TCO28813.1 carbohydrate binding protein with CBM6 domain [Pedobacter psychrotolerans]